MKRSPMKRSQPRRDWSEARAKCDREPGCRACNWHVLEHSMAPVEAAHIIGREHDRKASISNPPTETLPSRHLIVRADRIVPLCKKHHQAYDAHELDLLPYLTAEEQAQAVLDAGSIELARNRICGRAA